MEEKKTCCFFGHRKIAATEQLRERLYKTIEDLIIYEYVDFLCNHGQLKQALKFLKNKISTVESENVSNLLTQKYDELKTSQSLGFWGKLNRIFKK